MNSKKSMILNIVLVAGFLLILTVFSFLKEDRKFSQNENRLLAQKPEFTWSTLFSGKFSENYESYVTDQFVGRDEFITVKTYADILLGKKDIKGIYLGEEGFLLEQHLPDSISEEEEEKRLVLLDSLAKYCEAREGNGTFRVMLAPTADNILTDKLPAYASVYNQSAFLDKVQERVPLGTYVDAEAIINEHADEYIYYRTDHHWTTLGAYYAYTAWAKSMGLAPLSQEDFTIRTVTDSFLGTLNSKVNLPINTDTICIYEPKESVSYRVYYDLAETASHDTGTAEIDGWCCMGQHKQSGIHGRTGKPFDEIHGLSGIQEIGCRNRSSGCPLPRSAPHFRRCFHSLRR